MSGHYPEDLCTVLWFCSVVYEVFQVCPLQDSGCLQDSSLQANVCLQFILQGLSGDLPHFIGDLLSSLFGTITEEDVCQLATICTKLGDAVKGLVATQTEVIV